MSIAAEVGRSRRWPSSTGPSLARERGRPAGDGASTSMGSLRAGPRGARRPPHGLGPITAHRDTPQLRRGDELDARALGLVHLVDRGPAAIAHAGSTGGSGSLLVVPHEPALCPGEQAHHYKHRRRQDPHRGGTGRRSERCGVRTGEREGGAAAGRDGAVLAREGRGRVALGACPRRPYGPGDGPSRTANASCCDAPAQRRATRPALERTASRDAHRSACECTAPLSHGCGTRARPIRAAASSAAEAMVGFFRGIEAGLRGS